MKKLVLIFLMLLIGLNIRSLNLFAEDIYYPFDSITIVEAFKFDVTITTEPDPLSLLYGHVAINDVITIYVGTLEFIDNGIPSSGSANVLIVTGADGTDIVRFLINSYSYYPDVSRTYSFASHIMIDPLIGVHKDMSMESQTMIVMEDIVNNSFEFVDNKSLQLPAMLGTYEHETGLSIQISAYTDVGE